jgi:hypothetical protein
MKQFWWYVTVSSSCQYVMELKPSNTTPDSLGTVSRMLWQLEGGGYFREAWNPSFILREIWEIFLRESTNFFNCSWNMTNLPSSAPSTRVSACGAVGKSYNDVHSFLCHVDRLDNCLQWLRFFSIFSNCVKIKAVTRKYKQVSYLHGSRN